MGDGVIKDFYRQKFNEKKLEVLKRRIFLAILITIILGGPIWLTS